jgi:hypothetical protein
MMTKIALLTLISIGALWVNPATLTAQDATQDAPTIDPNAQQALAVRVHYAGVTLQLDGAQNAPALPVGAQTLMAQGDTVQTGETGRALLLLADGTQILLLPESSVTLDDYRQTEAGWLFSATVTGFMAQQTGDNIAGYTLTLPDAEVTQAGEFFGVWADEGEDTVVTSVEGRVSLRVGDSNTAFDEGFGARVHDGGVAVLPMSAPYNAARLVGLLDGCDATVQTRENTGLLVRRGAGQGFERMALIADGEPVRVMATTEAGFWTRIQFLSGFGWMQTSALVYGDCDAMLPTLPNETLETNDRRVLDMRPDEEAFIVPFFGNPLRDIWFYQTTD